MADTKPAAPRRSDPDLKAGDEDWQATTDAAFAGLPEVHGSLLDHEDQPEPRRAVEPKQAQRAKAEPR